MARTHVERRAEDDPIRCPAHLPSGYANGAKLSVTYITEGAMLVLRVGLWKIMRDTRSHDLVAFT